MPDRGRGGRGPAPPIGWKAEVLPQSSSPPPRSANAWAVGTYPSSPPPSWEEAIVPAATSSPYHQHQQQQHPRYKSPQRSKKGSKSLPNSPTKRGGPDTIPRAPSFPNSPDKKTRTHKGNIYMEVQDSAQVEKETVL